MDLLRDIVSVCQTGNAPNIRRLKLIDVGRVVKVRYPLLYNNAAALNYQLGQTSVLMLPGSKLINIGFISGTGTYEEKMEENEEGTGYINRVTISSKKDSPLNTLAVELMLGRGFLGFIEDRNGRCKVLGTVKQPLRLMNSALTIGRNEKVLTWQCKMPFASFFIPSIKNKDLLIGEFSDDFSDDFNI